MREKFQHHHQLDDKSAQRLWSECHFVLDASSLLNIYRYNNKTRQDFFKIITHIRNRLWVPYQAAKEFYSNRINVIQDQKKKYSELADTLDNSLKSLRDGKFIKSAFLNVDELEKAIKPGIEKARKIIEEQKNKHPDLIINDPYLDEITVIVGENIGDEPNCDELLKLSTLADERIIKKIPPGYLDSQKQPPQKYGDFFIWHEILEYAKKHQQPIIFITDDDKEDWWLKLEGRKLGPRPELREEIKKISGVDFHLINPSVLLETAEKRLKVPIAKESIINAATVSDELNSTSEPTPPIFYPWNDVLELRPSATTSSLNIVSKGLNKIIDNSISKWLESEFKDGVIYKGYGNIDYIVRNDTHIIGIQVTRLIDSRFMFLRSTISKIIDNIDETFFKEGYTSYLSIAVFATEKQAREAVNQITELRGHEIFGKLVVGYIDRYERFIKITQ